MRLKGIFLAEAAAATIGLLTVLGALAAVLAATQMCHAHDAKPTAAMPQGWSYPFSCCAGFDCRPVSSGRGGTVLESPRGYVIAKTGEVIPYSDQRVKPSQDSEFHWCSVAGANDGRTICLFVPPRGS